MLSLGELLQSYFHSMSKADFEGFCCEETRGVKFEVSIDQPAEVPLQAPLVVPELHRQEVSELDELVVAQVQPNQEAVAQEMLKRILLLTGK